MSEPSPDVWHDTVVLGVPPDGRDTVVLGVPPDARDAEVLAGPRDGRDTAGPPRWGQRQNPTVQVGLHRWQDSGVLTRSPDPGPGWYADPYDAFGTRYWDGTGWTVFTAATPARPRRRRSVAVAFALALLFGGLALPYALPLPGWVRLALAAVMVLLLGWWLLLLIPLTWPLAIMGVPLLTALLNPRR